MSSMSNDISVDVIIEDVMNAKRDLIVEEAVDEYLLAEQSLLQEATTSAGRMVDLATEGEYDDESQYLEDDEEINAMLDEEITDDIEGEDDIFQDTIDELDDNEDFEGIDIEDETDYEDIDSYLEDDDIDALIDSIA